MENKRASLKQDLVVRQESSASSIKCHFLGIVPPFFVYRCPRASGLKWDIHMGVPASPVVIELSASGVQLNQVDYHIVQLEGRPGIPWLGTPDEMIIGVAESLRGKGFWAIIRKKLSRMFQIPP